MSRAYTEDEVRKHFLDQLKALADYWAITGQDPQDACEGLVFSILALLDGVALMPAFEVRLSPHPDDKQFHQDQGENWYEPGTEVTDGSLHDAWSQKWKR